jgi:hypothetical protein
MIVPKLYSIVTHRRGLFTGVGRTPVSGLSRRHGSNHGAALQIHETLLA